MLLKTSKIMRFLLDIRNRMSLSIKLMVSNKMTLLVFALAMISTCFLLLILNEGAEGKSNIPIGIVNLDIMDQTDESKHSKVDSLDSKESKLSKEETRYSRELLEGLAKVEAISVRVGTFDELYLELMEGKIFGLFVINQGYEEGLLKGDFKNLITVYQGAESKTAKLLKDIVAGEMMYRVCLTRGITLYDGLRPGESRKFTSEEYEAYANTLKDSEQFDFKFDTNYVNTKEDKLSLDALNNQLLYRQMIGAIFALLLSFVILFAGTYLPLERGHGMNLRCKLSSMNIYASMLGNLGAILCLVTLLCLTFSGILSFYVGELSIFLPVLKVCYEYTIMIGVFVLLLGRIANNIFAYQFIGATFILLLGAGGMCSIVDEIMQTTSNLFRFLPNSWFIHEIADIILHV